MKERLSVSYVTAIAAKAGVACRLTSAPEYGTDAHFVHVRKLPNGKYRDSGYILNCQIKATTTCEIANGNVVYDMEVDAFNKLAEWEGGCCILILLWLPKEPMDWLRINEDELIMKKCCYWQRITDPPSKNRSTQRICIPRAQVFTPQVVVDLLDQIRVGAI
jgi:hypothetical protein